MLAGLVAGGLALAGCSASDPPGGESDLSIATGGAGGVYQVYGGALADQMTRSLPDRPTTAETTSASVDNLLLVADGESDVAFTLGDTAIDAVRGDAGFERPLNLRALGQIYPNITQVVVPAGSDIKTIADLEGHPVSIGAPNSGTEVIALRLLEAAGLDPEQDVNGTGLGVGESVAALRDGTIDAMFWSGGVPTGSITDLASTDDIRILDLSDSLPKLQERYGEAYEEAEIEEGDYENTPPTRTIGVPNLLMVDARMPDALAHDITQVLFERKAQLSEVTPQAESLDPAESSKPIAPLRLHPGAARYYREVAR